MMEQIEGVVFKKKCCGVEFCPKQSRSHGYCSLHVKRFLRHGNPNHVKRNIIRGPAPERFMRYVMMTESGCWKWIGKISKIGGYPHFGDEKWKTVRAHRWSFQHFNGPLVDGLVVDHMCRNRWCVNPKHLRQVTQKENIVNRKQRVLKTNCGRGHEYNSENTWVSKRGSRQCKICVKLNYLKKKSGGQIIATA